MALSESNECTEDTVQSWGGKTVQFAAAYDDNNGITIITIQFTDGSQYTVQSYGAGDLEVIELVPA